AEPDLDGGDVDGGQVHELAFVVSGGHGAELFEFVDGTFDGVAVPVALSVEGGWAPAGRSSSTSVGLLVALLRDGRLDATSAQVSADGFDGVGLVGQDPGGSGTRASDSVWDADGVHYWLVSDAVVALTGGGVSADRAARAVGGQVQLGAVPAAGAAQGLAVLGLLVRGGQCFGSPPGWSAGGWWRAPAACWWARITLLSRLTVQSSPSSRSASNRNRSAMRCQVPSNAQRRLRR